MKIMKKKNMFYKFMVSYSIIFAVPFFVAVFIYNMGVEQLERHIKNTETHQLVRLCEYLETQLDGLSKSALNIIFDKKMTYSRLEENVFHSVEGIKRLEDIKSVNPLIHDVMLYFVGDDNIYTVSGRVNKRIVAEKMYSFTDWEGMLEDIENVNDEAVFPFRTLQYENVKGVELLTYVLAYRGNENGYNNTRIVIMVSKEALQKAITDVLGGLSNSLYVFDEEGSRLISFDDDDYLTLSLADKLKQNKDGIYYEREKNKSFAVFVNQFNKRKWSSLLIIPVENVFGQTLVMRRIMWVMCVVLLAVGISFAIHFSLGSYRPIKSLIDDLENPSFEASGNELDRIRRIVIDAVSTKDNLMQTMESQKPFVANQILTKLVNGQIKSRQELDEMAKSVDIVFRGDRFCVFVLWPTGRISYAKDKMLSILNTYFSSEEIYSADMVGSDYVFAVAKINGDGTEQERRSIAEQIMKTALDEQEIQLVVAVGRSYDDILQVKSSYAEALMAGEYKYNSKEFIVLYEDFLASYDQTLWYPREEQSRLIVSLRQGDKRLSLEILDIIMEKILSNKASFLMAKYICYDIINAIVKLIKDMDIKIDENSLSKLMEYTDLEDFNSKIREVALNICECIEKRLSDDEDKFKNNVLQYINSNYTNNSLNLNEVAEKFNVSVFYLSRYIKEHTRTTFTDYLINLRITEAKRLLNTTDMTIKEIVNLIGYTDVSHFTRLFKKIEGLTPGEYKKRL